MSLHDRIMALNHGYEGACFEFDDGYGEAKKDAAQIAKEADELMAEMARELEIACECRYGDCMICRVLAKYNAWKESTT